MPTSCSSAAAGDDDLGVAGLHPVVGDDRRLDPGLDQQPQQAQADVEDDLHVDPGVVRHPQPLGVDLGHVPPGPHLVVVVDRLEEALELAVAPGRRPDLRLGDRLPRRLALRALGVGSRDALFAHVLDGAAVAHAADSSPSRRPARGWSPTARRAAPRGSPARPRGRRRGRRCRRPIPRFRSRTGTCRGSCRRRRRSSGRRRTRRRRSPRAVAIETPPGRLAKASRRWRRSSARRSARIRLLTTRIVRWKRATDGAIFEIASGFAAEMPIDRRRRRRRRGRRPGRRWPRRGQGR